MQEKSEPVDLPRGTSISRSELIAKLREEIARIEQGGGPERVTLETLVTTLRILEEADAIAAQRTRAPDTSQMSKERHEAVHMQAHRTIEWLRTSTLPRCIRLMIARSERKECSEDRKRRKAA